MDRQPWEKSVDPDQTAPNVSALKGDNEQLCNEALYGYKWESNLKPQIQER